MEEIVVRLRKISLRWVIVIMFAASIVSGISSFKSGGSLVLPTLILFGGSVLFYATWSAQAISNIKKALIPIYVISGATLINLIGQWTTISENVDFSGAVTDAIWGDDTAADNLIYSRGISSYPTQLFLNLSSAVVLMCTLRYVVKKYRFCWGGMSIMYLLSFVNVLMLVTEYNGYQTLAIYKDLNNIIAILSGIIFIVLLCKGGNNRFEPTSDLTNKPTQKTGSNSRAYTATKSMSLDEKSQQLYKLKELLDSGILSKEEFESEKAKILNK